jgi:hypothetical protein
LLQAPFGLRAQGDVHRPADRIERGVPTFHDSEVHVGVLDAERQPRIRRETLEDESRERGVVGIGMLERKAGREDRYGRSRCFSAARSFGGSRAESLFRRWR